MAMTIGPLQRAYLGERALSITDGESQFVRIGPQPEAYACKLGNHLSGS